MFMIPSEHHHNQNPHAYAYSNQMFQSDLPFGFWFTMEKTKKLHNLVYKLTLMNYKKKSLMNFKIIIPNWNLKTIHVSLFLQHNFNITHLIAYI